MKNPKDALRDEDRLVQATYVLLYLYVAVEGKAGKRIESGEAMEHTGFDWELLDLRVTMLQNAGYGGWEAGMGLSMNETGVVEAERMVREWLSGVSAGDVLLGLMEKAHHVLLEREWERTRVLDAAYEAAGGEPMVRVYPDEFGVWVLESDSLDHLKAKGFLYFSESRTFQVTEQGAAHIEEVRSWYPKSNPPSWTFEEFCQRYEAWVRRPESPTENMFRRVGKTWLIVYEGREFPLPHSIGMIYISHLLTNPEKEISVEELRSLTTETELGLGEGADAVDRTALREYKDRLDEVNDEREAASALDDFARIEDLDAEAEELLKQIGQGMGYRGHRRQMGDDFERTRQSVTRAIRRALTEIEKENEALGVHLRNSLKLRFLLQYKPDRPIRWIS